MSDPWDLIVVAHAPADVRRRRLVDLRGLGEEEAAARIASQVSDEERLKHRRRRDRDRRPLEHALDQTDELWRASRSSSRRDGAASSSQEYAGETSNGGAG